MQESQEFNNTYESVMVSTHKKMDCNFGPQSIFSGLVPKKLDWYFFTYQSRLNFPLPPAPPPHYGTNPNFFWIGNT